MKIVINALQYRSDGSGIAVNLRELFGRFTMISKRRCQIILPQKSPAFPCSSATECIEAPCTYDEGFKRIWYQSFELGRRNCTDTVLLTIDSKIPLLLPKSCMVVPLITDLAVFRMPEAYQRSRVLLWRLQYRYLCRRADRFLAISEFTKQEMTAILGIAPEQIDVIPCAAPEGIRRVKDRNTLTALRVKYKLPEHYVLFVGNFNPRKNLRRLMEAFDLVKQETNLPHELVIAGGQGWRFDAAEALKSVAAKDAVHFIGYVPDEDMPALYSTAELFVFPTLYEGFGIPVIEAQRCGTPVLTSNVSALPEVGGDGAAYVDPYDVKDIAQGMKELLQNEEWKQNLIERGSINAERFSWEASAGKLNEIVEGLIEEWTSTGATACG